MKKSVKIFAITNDINIQKEIILDMKKDNVEIFFFNDDFSVFTLMQFQPDMIIIDYKKKEFMYNQFSSLKTIAA